MTVDIEKLAQIYGPFVGQDQEADDVMALIDEIKKIVSENIAIAENAIMSVRKANRSLEIEIEHKERLVDVIKELLDCRYDICPWCLLSSGHHQDCSTRRATALVGDE